MGIQLEKIRYDEDFAIAHSDSRRTVYDPNVMFHSLKNQQDFYQHNILKVNQDGLELGNHFHDYDELFFTPTGEFDFRLVDIEDLETRRYVLKEGGRILIPSGIGHTVTGRKGDVLIVYGNAPFDQKRIMPCSKEALETLAPMKK